MRGYKNYTMISKEYIQKQKIVGIMQPYFFPYIGYWQLMNAVDQYVVYDDVNYINRGWINRNRILVNGEAKYYNLPLLGASQNKLIKDIGVDLDDKQRKRNICIIRDSYKKAPYYKCVFPLIEEVLACKSDVLSEYLKNSFEVICKYLNIETEIILSSDIEKDNSLKGENKIIAICEKLNATDYYNAIGGKELYHFESFIIKNIKLHFLNTNTIKYKQYDDNFLPNLSIIDVLMFNERERVIEMLDQYTLTSS